MFHKMDDNILELRDIIKEYELYTNNKHKLKSLLGAKVNTKKFLALNGIKFDLKKGESIGIVGINGSGKSTLSNIIAGLGNQTRGTIKINGSSSILSISAGLNGELTGRENIELKCLMLGLTKKKIKELEPKIIEFSELNDIIDQPVKLYSSGMKAKLGFSISISLEPDLYIIDEALSVGDSAFTSKALNRLEQYKHKGKSMIFVSHSLSQIEKFCDKILWLEVGRIKSIGKTKEVIHYYKQFSGFWKKLNAYEKKEYLEMVTNATVYKRLDNPNIRLYYPLQENYDWLKKKHEVRFELTSYLCHFKSGDTKIYKNISEPNSFELSKTYLKKVYYVKKQAIINNEVYFQLSKMESFKYEVVGWVKKKDLTYLEYKDISYDQFKVSLTGESYALSAPWGGGSEIVHKDLSKFKNNPFYVTRTVMIGKNVWFYGILSDTRVWVNSRYTFNHKL